MKEFAGFPAGKQAYIPVPYLFFSELLPEIDHLGELKVTLHVFWLLTQKKGARRYVSGEELARYVNDRLAVSGESALMAGNIKGLERNHLFGLVSFALASLATALVIVLIGSFILYSVTPILIGAVREAGLSLQYSLILVGAAMLLGTTNVKRNSSLFCAAFTGTLLVLWLR